jgi:FtsP/CotA-like multicopper oxidase with cupredoxin domain
MERRTFLAGTVAALSAVAGCVGEPPETPDNGAEPTDTEEQTGTDTPADGTPGDTDTPADTPSGASTSIVSRSLEQQGDCNSPGNASIATDGATVSVEGCITGRNGCMYPALGAASYDAEADELTVRVTTENESDPDEACTQALVQRGYEVTVEFDGSLPGTTTVYHDSMDEEQQVARSETGD